MMNEILHIIKFNFYKALKLIKDIIHCTWSAFGRGAAIKDPSAPFSNCLPYLLGWGGFQDKKEGCTREDRQ